MTARRPDLFIVGAPKCGTTSMARYLGQHPEIFMADGEPHYFGRDIEFHPRRMTESEYIDLFAGAGSERILGEKSTWYLYSSQAASEIEEYNPEARILMLVRNPVEVIHSLHTYLAYSTGREDILDFQEALEAEPDRRRGQRIPERARFPEHLFYSRVALFSEQIQRYVDVVGWERMHVVVFDDLKFRPLDAYREVLGFLGVSTEFTPDLATHNKSRVPRHGLLGTAVSHPLTTQVARWVVPESIRKSLRRGLGQWNSKPRPPLDEDARRRLQKQFLSEVECLSEQLGRDLTHWCND